MVRMKVSYWRAIAIAIFVIFIVGTLGGCGDTTRIEELQGQLAEITKERDELKTEHTKMAADASEAINERKAERLDAELEIEELKKENEEMKARLASQ